MDIATIVLIVLTVIIIGVIIYLIITFNKHKEENEDDFSKEQKSRTDSIKKVVDQVNKTHADMDDYNDTQFSIINTNVRANRDNIERTNRNFNNYTSNIDSIIRIRETFASDSNVAPAPSPALKKKDIDVLAQVNALGGVTIKDLDSTRPFKICGKTGNCIEIPNSSGDTYLRAINSNASLILDSPIQAYNDILFYQPLSKGVTNQSPYAQFNNNSKSFSASNIFSDKLYADTLITSGGQLFAPVLTGNKAFIDEIQIGATDTNSEGTSYITKSGDSKFKTVTLGDNYKFSADNTGGQDDWVRIFDKNNRASGIAMGKLWVQNNATVDGNLRLKGGVSSTLNPQNLPSEFPSATDNKNYIRGDTIIAGDTTQRGNLLINKQLHFRDSSGTDNTDSYLLEKITPANDVSSLRLTINDNADESLEIWARGGTSGTTGRRHRFDALGNVLHDGTVTAKTLTGTTSVTGKTVTGTDLICAKNNCLTPAEIEILKQISGSKSDLTGTKVTGTTSICAGNECLTSSDIQRLKAMTTPTISTSSTAPTAKR